MSGAIMKVLHKPDSFMYINKDAFQYICGSDTENSLNIYNLICRWDCFNKHNETLFDRTNTICGPLKVTNISPIPEFDINFNKSLKEICDMAATNILNEGKPVDIFWSGGIDSTVVVISFLNVCKDLSQINIVYDKGGIDEYPLFYEKYVRGVTQEPVKIWVYENINLDDNIVVTGHPAQFLSQSHGGHHLGDLFGELKRLGFAKDDFKTIPWQEVFISDVTVFGNPMYDEYFIEHITPQVENAPVKIETISDLWWWLIFSMRWQTENIRPLINNRIQKLNHQKMQNFKPFFSTDDFQKWAMYDYDRNLRKTLPPFKTYLKDIIYDFTNDKDYYINKKKVMSGNAGPENARRRGFIRTKLHKARYNIEAIDNQYNIFTADSLYHLTAPVRESVREDILNRYRNPDYV